MLMCRQASDSQLHTIRVHPLQDALPFRSTFFNNRHFCSLVAWFSNFSEIEWLCMDANDLKSLTSPVHGDFNCQHKKDLMPTHQMEMFSLIGQLTTPLPSSSVRRIQLVFYPAAGTVKLTPTWHLRVLTQTCSFLTDAY